MADSRNTPILSRRTCFGLAAALLAPSGVLASAAEAPASSLADDFDAAAYIDRLDACGLHSLVIYRSGRRSMYGYWSPEIVGADPDGTKFEAFIAELHRRGRAFHALPEEPAYAAEKRIRAALKDQMS